METILSSNESPLTLKEIAKKLNCSRDTLKYYFPKQCSEIIDRSKGVNNLNWQKKVLHETLLSDEHLPLKAIAKKLGCHCKVLRKRFPELCRSLEERYEKSFDSDLIEKGLEKALEHDTTPPSVSEIAKSLGYPEKILEHYYPELCSEIFKRRLTRLDISHLNVTLEAILASTEEPISWPEAAIR